MRQKPKFHGSAGDPERRIGLLLDEPDEQGTVVDRLMDMPLPSQSGAPERDTAVASRLETRLADIIRGIIGARESA